MHRLVNKKTMDYNYSMLSAKSRKSHVMGEELFLPAIKEIIKTVLPKIPSDIMR